MNFCFTTIGPSKTVLLEAFGAFDGENILKLPLPHNLSSDDLQKISCFFTTSMPPEILNFNLNSLVRDGKTGQNFTAEGTINGTFVRARFYTAREIAILIFKID